MEINVEEAFMEVFLEPKWISKFIIGTFLVSFYHLVDVGLADESIMTAIGGHIVAVVFFLKAFAGAMILFFCGYMIMYTHNKINDIIPALPKWGKYLKPGIFSFLILMFYMIIMLIPILAMHLNKQNMDIMRQFLLFLLTPIINFAIISYAKNLKLNDAFDFKNILSVFKRVVKISYIFSFIFFPYDILSKIIFDTIKLLSMNYAFKIPLILFYGFISFWLWIASTNIFVQIYKLSESRKSGVSSDIAP